MKMPPLTSNSRSLELTIDNGSADCEMPGLPSHSNHWRCFAPHTVSTPGCSKWPSSKAAGSGPSEA